MKRAKKLRSIGFLLCFPALVCGMPAHGSQDMKSEPGPIEVTLNTDEAEAVLAILDRTIANRSVDEALWNVLFSTEPYIRLKKREGDIGRRFNVPDRKFDDDDFKRFVLSDELERGAPGLKRALLEWEKADLAAVASQVLDYLPAGARIKAKVFPVIKPRHNSFVFELDTDPTVFLYLDPTQSRAEFENTVAHEMHHIGYASLDSLREKAIAGLLPDARAAAEYTNAFGEGFAMLAAAGGPDVHPHASSPPETRARWDRDMGRFNADLKEVEKFFLDILQGRLKTEAEREERGSAFFGVQGPWYTVGYKMSVMVEKRFGRPRLLECMLDPRRLLLNYNLAAAEHNRSHEDQLALWSPDLIQGLGLDAAAQD
jgi:hypothetical protein